MAGPNIKGLTVEIGADTTDLGKALADVDKKSRDLSSELGQINKLLKMDPSNTELLAQKQKVLADAISNTGQRLDTLKEAERQVQAQFERGEVSEEQVRALQREIIATEKKLQGYETAAKQTADQMDKMADEAEDAAEALDDAGDAAEDSGDGFSVAKGAAAEFIGNGLSALTDAAMDAIKSILELAEATREYRNEMGKLDTAFTSAGFTSEAANKTYKELQGILGDTGQAVEASNMLAKLCDDEEDLAEWTNILTGVYGTFGTSLPIEALAESANETARTGQIAGNLADALNWAAQEGETFGVKLKENIDFTELSKKELDSLTEAQRAEYEARKAQHQEIEDYNKTVEEAASAEDYFNIALSNCTTEQERQKLITETLNGLYSETADTFKENNASVIEANQAQENLAATQAELGETLEPLTTKFTEMKTQALQWLIDEGLPSLQSGFSWVKDNIPTLVAVIGTLTAAWLTFGGVQKLIDTWNKIVAISQKALNAVMNANPIGLVVTAVLALIAVFVTLWNNCEAFRNFWIGLWDGIKKAFSVVVDWVKENWQAMLLFLMNPLAGVFKYCYDHFEGFRNFVDNIVASVKKFFTDLWSNITQGARDAWSGIKNAFSSVATWFETIFSKAWTAVKNVFSTGGQIFDGIKEGIASVFTTVVNSIIRGINTVIAIPFDAINGVLNTIRNVGIGSVKPFLKLWGENPLPVPQISELARGGVLEKGQVGLLEGDGAEAVVPLEKNTKWLARVAEQLSRLLLDDAGGLSMERGLQKKATHLSPAILALEGLPTKLDKILTAIENGQVLTIDGNTLVGATAPKMDNALGQRRALAARGAIK